MEGTAWAQLYTCQTCDNVREQSAAARTASVHSAKTLNDGARRSSGPPNQQVTKPVTQKTLRPKQKQENGKHLNSETG